MSTLTKADIAKYLHEKLGITKQDASTLVDLFFQELRQMLVDGKPIKLSGFGCFELRNKRERPGRNPKTGKDAVISPRRIVKFRAGKKLRNTLDKILESQLNKEPIPES